MREETFGPVLPLMNFRSEEEAVRLANDSPFGLTASVWTRDIRKGRRVASRIEAGTVMVNEVLYTHGMRADPVGRRQAKRARAHARASGASGIGRAAPHPRQPADAAARRVGGSATRPRPRASSARWRGASPPARRCKPCYLAANCSDAFWITPEELATETPRAQGR